MSINAVIGLSNDKPHVDFATVAETGILRVIHKAVVFFRDRS